MISIQEATSLLLKDPSWRATVGLVVTFYQPAGCTMEGPEYMHSTDCSSDLNKHFAQTLALALASVVDKQRCCVTQRTNLVRVFSENHFSKMLEVRSWIL